MGVVAAFATILLLGSVFSWVGRLRTGLFPPWSWLDAAVYFGLLFGFLMLEWKFGVVGRLRPTYERWRDRFALFSSVFFGAGISSLLFLSKLISGVLQHVG